ncbi:hypothetical protein ACSXB9_16050 (plasmid) [Clostridium perfringens]
MKSNKTKTIVLNRIPNYTFNRFIEDCEKEGKKEQEKLIELITEKLKKTCVLRIDDRYIKEKKKHIFIRIEKNFYQIPSNLHITLKSKSANEEKFIQDFIKDLLVEKYG